MNYVICFGRLTAYERSFSVGAVWACCSWHTASTCIAIEHRPDLYQLMKHICDSLLEAAVCDFTPLFKTEQGFYIHLFLFLCANSEKEKKYTQTS